MSGFIRGTAVRALDLTVYLSPSSSPVSLGLSHLTTVCSFARVDVVQLPDGDSAPPRGDATVPGRSDAPPVLAASVQGPPEALPAAPVASSIISHAVTTPSALPGVSKEALRDIVDEDRNLAMSATQLASATKVLVRAMVQRPRSNDQGFWDQFNRAQTVEEVGSAITAGTEQVFDTSGDVGKLRARLDSAYADRQALEVQLLTQAGLRENAELFARQATAEIEELKTELRHAKDSDAAHLRRCMDAQASLDASTETIEKLRQFIKPIQESNLSIQKQV
ncbi:hypothetical protein PI124_g19721 [Phytophthora idaei]|nr:hypothetical protein PI125_g20751 [Phytophthora idaei]KAG3235240.1 hypothetical protein PI124_g19721 [Phytophthora idaei]